MFKKFSILLLAISGISLLSCSRYMSPAVKSSSSAYAKAPSNPSKNEMLRLVNNARKKGCNCGGKYYPPAEPLTWNNQLEDAAQKHSNYMNSTNRLSHTGRGNSSAGDRMKAEGYDWMSYGENIAAGYSSEEEAIQGWLNSAGHCKNIMNPKFKEMGVATSGAFWTQVFGVKK